MKFLCFYYLKTLYEHNTKRKVRQDKFMEEDGKLKLERNGAIVAHMPYEANKNFKKIRTIQNEELNFYIPEKWDYNQII